MTNSNDPRSSPPADDSTDGQSEAGGSPLKRVAGEVKDRAKSAAQKVVDQGKQRVERSVFSASSALRRAAEECETDNAWFSAALRKSADGIETAARSISQGDLGQVADQVNDFARRQPALFLGASLALGFAVARLGKTALENRRRDDEPEYDVNTTGGGYDYPETGI